MYHSAFNLSAHQLLITDNIKSALIIRNIKQVVLLKKSAYSRLVFAFISTICLVFK